MPVETFIDEAGVSEINERMARVETALEHQQRALDKIVQSGEQSAATLTKLSTIIEHMSDLEPRIAAIERRIWYWAGGLGLAIVILGNIDLFSKIL